LTDTKAGPTTTATTTTTTGEQAPLPAYVTTPLLTRITESSLDEDYRVVAARRAAQAGGASTPSQAPVRGGVSRGHWVAAGVVVAFGLLVSIAAVQTARNADVTSASRAALVSQVEDGRAALARRQEQIARLQKDYVEADDRNQRLIADALAQIAALREQQAVTGYVAVRGPGVVVTVDDAPGADVTGLVVDEDLAMLADGLWQAGAEAVAINGQRLTTLSAIRNSGQAIRVNSRPVNPPYVVQAIGDPRTLPADLLDTTHGARFFDIAGNLGFPYKIEVENATDGLTLPASRPPRLRHVQSGTSGANPGVDEEVNP
jgi:uncharacterized protein YlxW (UPF0749 family)